MGKIAPLTSRKLELLIVTEQCSYGETVGVGDV
jgi:hypothetical protein